MPTDPSQADPSIVALMHGVKASEGTNGNYNQIGDQGTAAGIAQWSNEVNGKPQKLQSGQVPANFQSWAKQYNLDPNDFSPENQNKLLYARIADRKKAGLTPEQILSEWNSGDPNKYLTAESKGTGPVGGYDVAGYVKRGMTAAQQYAQQRKTASIPAQTPADSSSEGTSILPNVSDIGHELGTNIASRFQQGSDALSMLSSGLSSGDLGKSFSGGLQTAGAVAGGVGDIANSAFELIPGVQALEKGISSAMGSFAQTPTGQKIVQGVSQFSQAHPEISGDLGAAVNIASVIPMFKGLSLIKGGVTDAAVSALKGNLSEAAGNEIKSSLNKTALDSVTLAEKRGLDPIGHLTSDHENLPSIVENQSGNYVYDGSKAASKIQSSLSQDEANMQSLLSQPAKKNILVSLNDARQQMLKDILSDFRGKPATGTDAVNAVNQYFDKIENYEKLTTKRNYIGVEELNNFKRELGGQVNWQNLGVKAGEIKSSMYRSLMGQVENTAKKAGIDGVSDLNKVMGNKIEALKALKGITGKTVKQSKLGKVIREVGSDVAGGGAELAGNAAGIPFAATLAGRGLYKLVPGRVPLTATRLLGRSGRGTVKSSLTKGLVKSGTAQGLRGLVSPQK